jgi:NADH oxidase (H2O-forming)
VGRFGSYGWSGEAGKLINTTLQNLKLDVQGDGVYIKFTPHENEQEICMEYGRQIGAKVAVLED